MECTDTGNSISKVIIIIMKETTIIMLLSIFAHKTEVLVSYRY
jgi:hypothetical protein